MNEKNMRVTLKFLRGLSVGSKMELEDVENVSSVLAMCTHLKRTEGKVKFNVQTFPLERKVKIKVLPYDY